MRGFNCGGSSSATRTAVEADLPLSRERWGGGSVCRIVVIRYLENFRPSGNQDGITDFKFLTEMWGGCFICMLTKCQSIASKILYLYQWGEFVNLKV